MILKGEEVEGIELYRISFCISQKLSEHEFEVDSSR